MRDGRTRREACKAAGIGKSTFYRWMRERPGFRAEIAGAMEYRVSRVAGDLPRDWDRKVERAREELAKDVR